MNEKPKNKTIRDTDQEALALAGTLINGAMHGALAATDPNSEFPHISRIQLSTDSSGDLITLISSLSSHTKCVIESPQCAILIGEAGKGDPLAHPRISVRVVASEVPRNAPEFAEIRANHLAHYPKAELYVDFGDFSFFRLAPQSAALNGGFGKAFELTKDEVIAAVTGNFSG